MASSIKFMKYSNYDKLNSLLIRAYTINSSTLQTHAPHYITLNGLIIQPIIEKFLIVIHLKGTICLSGFA